LVYSESYSTRYYGSLRSKIPTVGQVATSPRSLVYCPSPREMFSIERAYTCPVFTAFYNNITSVDTSISESWILTGVWGVTRVLFVCDYALLYKNGFKELGDWNESSIRLILDGTGSGGSSRRQLPSKESVRQC